MRETSLAAYSAVHDALSEQRGRVFLAVCETPGLTAAELESADPDRRHWNKRLSELERLGVCSTGEPRPCAITGHSALTWFPTGNLPRKLDKPLTWKQRAERLQAELDATRQALAAAKAGELMAEAELIALRTLAKAFRGELVPQDPDDEPALTLFERIKAEHDQPHDAHSSTGRRIRKSKVA